jgi:hypothetical protein
MLLALPMPRELVRPNGGARYLGRTAPSRSRLVDQGRSTADDRSDRYRPVLISPSARGARLTACAVWVVTARAFRRTRHAGRHRRKNLGGDPPKDNR